MMKNFNIKDISKLLKDNTTPLSPIDSISPLYTDSNTNIRSSINILKDNDIISADNISIKSEKSSDNISTILNNINRTESPDNNKKTPLIRINSFSNENKNSITTPILKYNKPDFSNINNKKASILDNKEFIPNLNIPSSSSPLINNTIPFSRTNSNEYVEKYNIDEDDEEYDKKDPLIRKILKDKEKLNKNLFILSVKYDRICYKYNTISLTIMILSTISTFIEAARLTMTEYLRNNQNALIINVDIFTLSINILMLVLGTVITILSSIVRFKNYRETMEKLKNYQNIIVKYKILYDKQIDIIKTFKSNNKELDDETFKELNNKLREYNKEVNENINLIEDIRNDDKVKLQQFKHIFDIKLDKMKQERNLELLKNKNNAEIKKNILNDKKELEMMKIKNKKNKNNSKYDEFKYKNIDNNDYDFDNSRRQSKKEGTVVTMANFDIVSTI